MKKCLVGLVGLLTMMGTSACMDQDLICSKAENMNVTQKAYDTSCEAETYTAQLLRQRLLDMGIEEYEIKMKSGTFSIGNNSPIYLISYCYQYSTMVEYYGYQLKQQDGGTFEVLDEGSEAGKFILDNSEAENNT